MKSNQNPIEIKILTESLQIPWVSPGILPSAPHVTTTSPLGSLSDRGDPLLGLGATEAVAGEVAWMNAYSDYWDGIV